MVLVPSLGILLFNRVDDIVVVELEKVLVPSLGILLFNPPGRVFKFYFSVLVPSLGILLFNHLLLPECLLNFCSRPLSGDSFI